MQHAPCRKTTLDVEGWLTRHASRAAAVQLLGAIKNEKTVLVTPPKLNVRAVAFMRAL